LKTEQDGRMFPNTDSSRTIVDFLLKEARRLGIALLRNTAVVDIAPIEKDKTDGQGGWKVVSDKKSYRAKKILLSTGGNPKIWRLLARLGHAIVDPVPSLFTFNIDDPRIRGIQGVSTNALVEVLWKKTMAKEITVPLRSQQEKSSTLVAEGPLLITHWGMSGPAILKLSAWGAKVLNEYQYKFTIRVNWLPDYQKEGLLSELMQIKEVEARKTILRTQALEIPRRLWINLVTAAGITRETKWASVTRKQLDNLASQLTQSVFPVHGKSTFKEEFVTAGGVDLKEINFKTFESKIHPNLYFAGEIIDVDAITGGFNFQNAWTGAYIAARAIAGK
ncbi:MAG TPA: aminoacetone oxidase family FAD-binding enzyme, partial [Eudoraea sp.]|nr:aminoacetone oxidase family FAD-binding enzyme [Eudoraea sp.]